MFSSRVASQQSAIMNADVALVGGDKNKTMKIKSLQKMA